MIEVVLDVSGAWVSREVEYVSLFEAVLAEALQNLVAVILHLAQVRIGLLIGIGSLLLLPDRIELGHSKQESELSIRFKPIAAHLVLNWQRNSHLFNYKHLNKS